MGHGHHHGHSHGDDHGHDDGREKTPREKKQSRALKIVFGLNAGMAIIEGITGYVAHSKAMMADTLDMAGDAVSSGASVIVQKKSQRTQAWVALAKAGLMMAMGLGVLAGAAFAIMTPVLPVMATMGIVGALALGVNTASFALLYPYRNDNINIKSTMMCMRNDMISNVAVLGAAALGAALVSPIPDIVVGIAISGLFLKSSVDIAREALGVLYPSKKSEEKAAKVSAPAPQKPAPKNAFSLKKSIGSFFNRKAKADAPSKQAPQPAPQNTPAPPKPV